MNPHEHEWRERKRPVKGGVRTERRCEICGAVEGLHVTTHEHSWRTYRDRDGLGGYTYVRHCLACGERQTKVGFDAWETRAPVDEMRTGRRTAATRISQHGGIVGYDPATETVTVGDGTKFPVEALAAANPGISHQEIATELRRRFPTEVSYAEAFKAMASTIDKSMEDVAESFEKLSASVSGNPVRPTHQVVKKWTSDDALKLILEEIKHAPDVMKAAGAWITKFTNGVTDITRNLDDQ